MMINITADNAPSLPSNWRVLTFEEAFNDSTGGSPKVKQRDYLIEGCLPVIDQGQKYISGYVDNQNLACKASLPCVVFGDHTKIFKYVCEPFALGADGVKILTSRTEIDQKFAYYYLTQIKLPDNAGYSRHFKFLKRVLIPVPPLPEQKRIAAILDKADMIRRKRQLAIKKSEDFLRSVFLDMFGDPVTNPKGWDLVKISDITQVGTGSTPSRTNLEYYGGQIPWVKTTEVNSSYIYQTEEYITEDGLRNSNCEIYPDSSLVIAMYGQGKTRGRVGVLGCNAATNQACAVLLPSAKYITNYLFEYLKLSYEQLRELGRGGNQPNLNLSIVRDFKIILPPIENQKVFSETARKTTELIGHLSKQLQTNLNLFDSLSYLAFRGELTNQAADELLKEAVAG